ncbi:hypothetical protein PHISCL_08752 [Aspergillus sclerotialis]|uniref:BTB domain-containing protein n=1 Tax=Aspergillus sclerotialis TaxID=2070753 RepID=A0A3A2Z9K1_9EURO|nr:hypothetical protein PHISCL_08752 [Aspergillus sclerotialis]
MLLAYHETMQSGTVEFVIGKDRKRFSIHKALASSFPKEVLQLPINAEVDEIVFGRCCEFVYSGDYSVPLPVSKPSGSDGGQPSNSKILPKGPLGRWNPANHTRNTFHPTALSCVYAHLVEQHQVPEYRDGEDVNTNPADDYSEVFLSHAQIFCFSYRTDWSSLCALSLYRLIRLLANFTLFEERTGDIVKLLSFIFKESEIMEDIEVVCKIMFHGMWKL